MNRNYKWVSVLLLLLMLVSCVNKTRNSLLNKTSTPVIIETVVENKVYQKDSVKNVAVVSYPYTIVRKKDATMSLSDGPTVKKMIYTVEIQSELSKTALDEIADKIANSETCKYVFIEYYLPTQDKNGPNYGISKRTPTLNNSEINYIAPPKEPVRVKTPYDGCKVYGKWNMIGAVVIVYQKGNNCYMVTYFGDSNYGEPEKFIKTTYKGCTAFKNAEDHADLYVINKSGNLDGYYEGDLACTFSKAQ